MTDLAWLSVAEGAALLRAKKLSPVEWTKALLDRIAAIDGHYNAFLAVTADKALAQAKAAEAEIAKGQYRGPMHGVPYAAKDIFDIEGMATTCHSKIRASHKATSDAFVVKKLRDAGAVLLGKVALHEFATGGPAFDRRNGAGRARHRHRRLGAQPGDLLRHRRHEADLRRGVAQRRVPPHSFA